MITWDEPKRRENLRKHRIDLGDLESVFDYPMVTVEDACSGAESSSWSGRHGVMLRLT